MMKAIKLILLILALLFTTTNCGIKKAMGKLGESAESIAASIEKVTNAATDLLNKINDISRLVDSKLESGEITQGIADLIDGRLQTVSELLETTIQNSGGYVFDRLDGSVDNAFDELGKLLDELLNGVLGNYIPAIIDQISAQMQLQINTITSSMEDLIVVTAGQTIYVIDKTINGLVITFSIIILAIGLIIFAIIFLRKGRRITGANYIGIGLIAIFLAFFLVLALSSTVRGMVISGFDYGAELKVKEITPKITGIIPQNIVLGKTKRIYIYGTHLNKLEKITVKLTQGGSEKFSFPRSTLIVNTSNRIILGNLDKELQWTVPLFRVFRAYMAETAISGTITESQMVQVNRSLNATQYPEIKPGVSVTGTSPSVTIHHSGAQPGLSITSAAALHSLQNQRVEFAAISKQRMNIAVKALGPARSAQYLRNINTFFFNRYKIAEGDYGLIVFADTVRIESPQYITVNNPPPPIPDPDIFVMNMNWTGSVIPVARQSASLDITFGFTHPEQIQRSFNARITTIPYTTSIRVNVPEGKIAAASSGNKTIVTTNPFTISATGSYLFNCSVDDENEINESVESNNTFSKYLQVGEYLYDVTLTNFSFELLSSSPLSQNVKLSFSLIADAGNNPTGNCQGSATVKSNTTTPLNCSFGFPGMREGQTVMLTFIPVVKISIFGLKYNFSLGNVTWQKHLDVNPTGMNENREYDILREGKNYKLHGKMTITRKKSL